MRKRVLNTKLLAEKDEADEHEGGAEVNGTVESNESDDDQEENINEE